MREGRATRTEPDGEAGFVAVAVPVPVRRLFTYSVPRRLADRLEVGARVRVRFAHRRILGTVVEWPAGEPQPEVDVRPLDGIDDQAPRLSGELLELTRFIADYYLCSWGEAIETALPPRAGSAPVRRFVRRRADADPSRLSSRATAQRRLFESLPPDGTPVPLERLDPATRRLVPALVGQELVERIERMGRRPLTGMPRADGPRVAPPTPTGEQAAALARLKPLLDADRFAAVLLYGATGSGKTEVYFRAAQSVLARGRGVIYLVPEIGLTPLLLSRVAQRFEGQAVVLHSGLPRATRLAAWEALRSGRSRFVVGTRSAIFAPVREPGLIVVDEEQDGSYKQSETPRYNGRDVAIVRGRNVDAVVLMGSATPSMETFHHATVGRYHLVELGGRVDQRPLPDVLVVDMRREFDRRGTITPVSETLILALGQCLERGEQALVLRNRRGWASALFCATCGNRVSCDRCSVALTWHRRDERLRCHYCGIELPFPEACPTCGQDTLKLLGEGTERVEDILRRELPRARIERMDRDSLRRKGAHEAMLRRFEGGEIDVLVGTQMIAKGHDFPRVTLVGVVSADHSLGLPDFRAGERTFQLLVQVAGRAGRGERPGRVVAQAFDPGHPLIRVAVSQDFVRFYEGEIRYRRALRYPPFTALVQLMILDASEGRAREWGATLAEELRQAGEGRLILSGPGPAPIERIKGRFRIQILVRSAGRRRLVQAVDRALTAVEGRVPRRAIQIDVDPTSVL